MKRAPRDPRRPSAGLPFSVITGKRLPRWTSLRFRRSPSARSIAFSSSVTIVGVKHPTSLWIVQQLREAFPFGSAPSFIVFDRNAKYGLEVPAAVRSLRVNPVRTSFESPWQNGVAERWVGSCRRDLLDHVIAVDERHLKRLLCDHIRSTPRTARISDSGKGNPRGQTSHHSLRSRRFSHASGRAAPPVRSGCLIRTNAASRKHPGSSILIHSGITARAFLRERFLALGGEGLTWTG
jgi:hypothetical protein